MRFLIVKTSALGDIIHTFSVLKYLRQKFPRPHHIDWVVEKGFAELVKAHPDVDNTLCIDSKNWRKGRNLNEMRIFRQNLRKTTYDAVFDLQGNIKSSFVTFQAKSKNKVGFGWKSAPEWPNGLFLHHRFNPLPEQNIRDDYLNIAKSYFNDHSDNSDEEGVQLDIPIEQQMIITDLLSQPPFFSKTKVMVCPGSAWKNKQMSTDGLIKLLQKTQKQLDCVFLFIWGNEEERREAHDLHKYFGDQSAIIDRLPLPTLQNLMAEMQLIITMDSLPLHLAGTTATPTLSIFGPSSHNKYKPKGTQHVAYQGSCPYNREFSMRCKLLRSCPTGACIRQLTGDEVLENLSLPVID